MTGVDLILTETSLILIEVICMDLIQIEMKELGLIRSQMMNLLLKWMRGTCLIQRWMKMKHSILTWKRSKDSSKKDQDSTLKGRVSALTGQVFILKDRALIQEDQASIQIEMIVKDFILRERGLVGGHLGTVLRMSENTLVVDLMIEIMNDQGVVEETGAEEVQTMIDIGKLRREIGGQQGEKGSPEEYF